MIKTKNNSIFKVFSIMLALVLILGIPSVVFAEEPEQTNPCPHDHIVYIDNDDEVETGEGTHEIRCEDCTSDLGSERHQYVEKHDLEHGHWYECERCGHVMQHRELISGEWSPYSPHNFVNNVCLVCKEINTTGQRIGTYTDDFDFGNSGSNSGTNSDNPENNSDSTSSSTAAVPTPNSEIAKSPMSVAVDQIQQNVFNFPENPQTVIIKSNSVSNDVMSVLNIYPGSSIRVDVVRNGEPLSITIKDPIIVEPCAWYGTENLIGIYNRGIALEWYKTIPGVDIEAVKAQMIIDAKNAKLGIDPVIIFPAGLDYIV